MRDALSHAMPISERISFLYFERTVLERDGHALVAISGADRIQIPIGRTSVMMLGPGTTVSQSAVSLCALEGALLVWVGEAGVRMYAAGNPRSDGTALLRQCGLRISDEAKLSVARKLYRLYSSGRPEEFRLRCCRYC